MHRSCLEGCRENFNVGEDVKCPSRCGGSFAGLVGSRSNAADRGIDRIFFTQLMANPSMERVIELALERYRALSIRRENSHLQRESSENID